MRTQFRPWGAPRESVSLRFVCRSTSDPTELQTQPRHGSIVSGLPPISSRLHLVSTTWHAADRMVDCGPGLYTLALGGNEYIYRYRPWACNVPDLIWSSYRGASSQPQAA